MKLLHMCRIPCSKLMLQNEVYTSDRTTHVITVLSLIERKLKNNFKLCFCSIRVIKVMKFEFINSVN